MARWVSGSGRWTDCHFVLTRCGFLHWFNNSPPTPADIVPADSLNLSRSVMSAGKNAVISEYQLQMLAFTSVAPFHAGRWMRLGGEPVGCSCALASRQRSHTPSMSSELQVPV